MSKNLMNLEELNIGQCVSITDDGLKSVCENMKGLKAIDLYGCTKVSSKTLEKIKKSIPSLKLDGL
jgi:F-box/leucine-rich repeat protein 14